MQMKWWRRYIQPSHTEASHTHIRVWASPSLYALPPARHSTNHGVDLTDRVFTHPVCVGLLVKRCYDIYYEKHRQTLVLVCNY